MRQQIFSKRTSVDWFALRFVALALVVPAAACDRHAGMPLARVRGQTATGPLRVNPANPRYFTDGTGKGIYLAGSHTWANLQDHGTLKSHDVLFDYPAYIRWMVVHNLNFMRLWTSELPDHGKQVDAWDNFVAGPYKWVRRGPGIANDGGPKFDLSRLDPAFFEQMRSRIILARDNGIYVSVMLFNGFEWQFETNSEDGNPFQGSNNINGVNCPVTCPTDLSQMPETVWNFEQAYIRKVVDTVNDLNNVLYEVSNEAGAPYSDSWQFKVIKFVKDYEAAKPKQHPIGMTFQWKGGSDETLYESAADWISPDDRLPEGKGTKVIINDTDHSYGWLNLKRNGKAAQVAWVWQNFTLGNNVAFMDPYLVVWPGRNSPGGSTADPRIGAKPDDYWDAIRDAMGSTLTYANRMNLVAMTPQAALSSTHYCLANPGVEYLVYQPSFCPIRLNLAAGTYRSEWLQPSTNRIVKSGTLSVSAGDHFFFPPFTGDAVLYLKSGKPNSN